MTIAGREPWRRMDQFQCPEKSCRPRRQLEARRLDARSSTGKRFTCMILWLSWKRSSRIRRVVLVVVVLFLLLHSFARVSQLELWLFGARKFGLSRRNKSNYSRRSLIKQ